MSGDAHRHDLPLQPHLHAVERHFGGGAVFHLEAGEFRHGFEMGDQFGDRRLAAGDRAVDAFAGEQQRALDAAPAAEGGERRAQLLEAVEPAEAVERRDAESGVWMNSCASAYRFTLMFSRPGRNGQNFQRLGRHGRWRCQLGR